MIRLIKGFDREDWNKMVFHPLQSWEWGEAKKDIGNLVIRFMEMSSKKKKGYQATLHPFPLFGYKIGYFARSFIPSLDLIKFLRGYGRKKKIIFFKFEPNERWSENSESFLNSLGLQLSSTPLFPDWTQVLDLSPSLEKLLAKMKSKTRYNIRLAERKGVKVVEDNSQRGFQIFTELFFETCRRQNFRGHSSFYHERVWKRMKKYSHILIAYYHNEPISAYHLFKFRDVLYYPYGGSSRKYKNVMGNNLIMWESIKLGKRLGAKRFDLWGSLPPNYDRGERWAGFTRFKEGFGTEFVRLVGSWDLVINRGLYLFYKNMFSLRKILLRFNLL